MFVGHFAVAVWAALLLAVSWPIPVQAQFVPNSGSTLELVASSVPTVYPTFEQVAPNVPAAYPTFQRNREIVLGALGVGTMAASFFVSIDYRVVPSEGLDPADIRLSVDRDIVGNNSTSAVTASNWTRNAALLMPWAMVALTGPDGERGHAVGARTVVYAETFFISMGLTALGKSAFSQPRPFAYLPEDQRPVESHFDTSQERTFVSMPSGHASSAWTATGLAMTEHLLYRPHASGLERAGVGFLAGALGGSTARLRVEAGQHFPTEVVAGSALGLVSGVTVPLLHHGNLPLPSARAWLQMSGGMLVGTLAGVLLGAAF